jgi:flagellar biosynthesis repressor protein FlbT
MPLRFDLAPFEKLHIGKAILCNSHERVCFALEGDAPVMRGKDVLQPELAVNCLEKLYCCMQKIYLEQTFAEHKGSYLALVVQALKEETSLHAELRQVDGLFQAGEHYKALKRLKTLIRPSAFVADRSEPETYVRRVSLASRT